MHLETTSEIHKKGDNATTQSDADGRTVTCLVKNTYQYNWNLFHVILNPLISQKPVTLNAKWKF